MGLNFNDIQDFKYNPFTDTHYYTSITNESHVVPAAPINGGYIVKLYHAPRETVPSSVVITIGATTLTEVASTVTPANNQYRVWYDDKGCGSVEFHANQAGLTALISYQHYGTFHQKESFVAAYQILYIVYDLASWQNIITRVSANVYKIADGYTNLYFRNLAGGYPISSILAGGDTWGVISTNQCKSIDAEMGACLLYDTANSYISVNTNDFYLNKLGILGDGIAKALSYGIYIDSAERVSINNSWITNINSNTLFVCFYNAAAITTSSVKSSNFNNIRLYSITCSNTFYTFFRCNNISNIKIYNNALSVSELFNNCADLNNIEIFGITNTSTTRYFTSCYNVGNINIYNCSSSNIPTLFLTSYNLSHIIIDTFTQTVSSTGLILISTCVNVKDVMISTITAVKMQLVLSCSNVDGISVSGTNNSNNATASVGISTCSGVKNCSINNILNAGAGTGHGYTGNFRCYGNTGTGNKTALFSGDYFSSDNSVACAAGNGNA
jgi:hypothetical protein